VKTTPRLKDGASMEDGETIMTCENCSETEGVIPTTFLTPHGRGMVIIGWNEITFNLCEQCDETYECSGCGKRIHGEYFCPDCGDLGD
jgi:hypothetical protein